MGYYTTHTGKITINPPLNNAQIRELRLGDDLDLAIDTTETHDEHGCHIVRTARAIEPMEGDIKAYDMLDHLRTVVAALPDHDFHGRIECLGEDGAQWRYVARGRTVDKVEPQIIWPDEA